MKMKKTDNVFLQLMGNTPRARVLQYFMETDKLRVSIEDVARGCDLLYQRAADIMTDLHNEKIIFASTSKKGLGYVLGRSHLANIAREIEKAVCKYQIERVMKTQKKKR
jgi:hypothetical protein